MSDGDYAPDIPQYLWDSFEIEGRTIAYRGHSHSVYVVFMGSIEDLQEILDITYGWIGHSRRYPGYFELDIAVY